MPNAENPDEGSEYPHSKNAVLVRGADGSLYVLREKDLEKFKLSEADADRVKHILGGAQPVVVVRDLPPNVLRDLHSLFSCSETQVEVIFGPEK
jgi:hypothetical protein